MTIDLNSFELDIILESLETYKSLAHHEHLKFDYVSCNNLYHYMIGFNTRGLRNNNPFNLKQTPTKWVGKKSESSDPVFEQFDNMYYGIRAGMLLLRNYVINGFNTPRKIIEKFAPRCENSTSAYLSYIVRNSSGFTFVGTDEVISSLPTLCRLASRMVQYENALSPNVLSNIGCTPQQLHKLCIFYNINF